MLNIQNKSVYLESEDRYDDYVNILVKDRTLPDVLVVSDRDTLKELIENDLTEDLTDVLKRVRQSGSEKCMKAMEGTSGILYE